MKTPDYDNGEKTFSQHEQLELMGDLLLSAVDLATALDVTHVPDHYIREYIVDTQLPGGEILPTYALPDCFRDVHELLEEITVQFSGNRDDDRVEVKLTAEFQNRWQGIISKSAYPAESGPFVGDISQKPEKSDYPLPDEKHGYPASAAQEEVAAFISSLIHQYHFQDTVQPITDPASVDQADAIGDTLEHSLAANVILTKRYEFELGDELYQVISEWNGGKVTAVDIVNVLHTDVLLDKGIPRDTYHKLVGRIELSDFKQGIEFHVESEEGSIEEENLKPEMLQEIRKIIREISALITKPVETELDTGTDDEARSRARHQFRYGDTTPDVDPDDDSREDGFYSPDTGA